MSVEKNPMPKIELMSEGGRKMAVRIWMVLRDLLSSVESRDNWLNSREVLSWIWICLVSNCTDVSLPVGCQAQDAGDADQPTSAEYRVDRDSVSWIPEVHRSR